MRSRIQDELQLKSSRSGLKPVCLFLMETWLLRSGMQRNRWRRMFPHWGAFTSVCLRKPIYSEVNAAHSYSVFLVWLNFLKNASDFYWIKSFFIILNEVIKHISVISSRDEDEKKIIKNNNQLPNKKSSASRPCLLDLWLQTSHLLPQSRRMGTVPDLNGKITAEVFATGNNCLHEKESPKVGEKKTLSRKTE